MDKSRDPPKDYNQDKAQLPLESEKGIYITGVGASWIGAPEKRRQEGQDDERKHGKQIQSI